MVEAVIGEQVVAVILDSGSGSLAVPKIGLENALPQCNGDKQKYLAGTCAVGGYDPSQSKTMEDYTLVPVDQVLGCQATVTIDGIEKCGAVNNYGDGSAWDGYLVKDQLKIGKLAAKVSLASVTKYFDGDGNPPATMQEGPAAGIMGVSDVLGWVGGVMVSTNCLHKDHTKTGNPTCRPDAFNEVLKSNNLDNIYGVCLGAAPSDGHPKPGVLTLGKSDTTLFQGKMLYAKLDESAYFNANVEGWGVGGTVIATPPPQSNEQDPQQYLYPATVDTGSNMVKLPKSYYDQVVHSGMSCATDDDCMLTVQLSGEEQPICMEIKNPDLLSCKAGKCALSADDPKNAWLLPQTDDPKHPLASHTTMLGFAGLSHAYLEFDRKNGRVGFAERSDKPCKPDCMSYLQLDTCQIADGCSWSTEKNVCSGTATGGNMAAGSKVTAGPCKKSFEITV